MSPADEDLSKGQPVREKREDTNEGLVYGIPPLQKKSTVPQHNKDFC